MSAASRAFVMVWDGMRPDMISQELTPNLFRLTQEGVHFQDSHAVFPTVTRINSTSLATGAYPASHGILGNSLYVPGVNPKTALNMGDHRDLEAVAKLRGGRAVMRESLADRVGARGGKTVVVSTGSPGSAWLCHPRIRERADAGDRLLHPVIPTPDTALDPVVKLLGAMPDTTIPNSRQNLWFTRAIAEYVLPELDPTLLVFWHTDPDKTQHHRGFGSPQGNASIRDADTHLGMVLEALDGLGDFSEAVVAVASDHGYVSIDPQIDSAGPDGPFLAAGLADALAAGEIVLAANGGSLYISVPSGDRALLGRIVDALAVWPHGSVILSRPFDGSPLPGTLPLEAVGIGGEWTPDILCALNWDDTMNEYGLEGRSAGLDHGLKASHGGISTWEVNNTLVMSGAGIKPGLSHQLPACNIDLAPTLAELLGVGPLAEADGRVLSEALEGGPHPREIKVTRETLSAQAGPRKHRIQISTIGTTRYLDLGWTE